MRTRAFTLIETVVALSMSVVILGAVVTIMLVTIRGAQRARAISSMQRDMAFVGQLFSSELRQAGLGVPLDNDPDAPPFGEHIVDDYGAALRTAFDAPILVATPNQVGIVGDLPRDDANYPAFGFLHGRPLATGGNHILWHNENNGSCGEDTTDDTCKIGDTSLFFPDPDTSGCNEATDNNCPWGLRRVLEGERILIADGIGRWATARFDGTVDLVNVGPPITTPYAVKMGRLDTSWGADPAWTGAWPDVTPGVSAPDDTPTVVVVGNPGEVPGGGFVSTPDRVFYRLTSSTGPSPTCIDGAPNYCVIERRRCFGDPDPDDGNFVAGNPIDSPTVKSNCGPWEVVARNVESLTFTYFNQSEGKLAATLNTGPERRSIRRIAYTVVFKKLVEGRIVGFTGTGSVRLQSFF